MNHGNCLLISEKGLLAVIGIIRRRNPRTVEVKASDFIVLL
jgi:hypothetical protein